MHPAERKWLCEKHGMPLTYDDDAARDFLSRNIQSGVIEIDEWTEVLEEAVGTPVIQRKLAIARKMVANFEKISGEPGEPREPTSEELTKKLMQRVQKDYGIKFDDNPEAKGTDMNDGKYSMATSKDVMDMAIEDHERGQGSGSIRVKNESEKYKTDRTVLKHAKWEREIYPIRNGSVSPEPVQSLSEWEMAKIGVWQKWKAAKAGFATLNEHDRAVLHEAWEKDTWIGYEGDEFVKRKNIKALIDDSTSGGQYLVPEYFDNKIVSFPLLHSEILPYVDQVDIPRGSTVETASVGNPTLTWNTAEATSQSLFNTTSLVGQIQASVFPVAVYVQLGRDLMSNSLPMIGMQLMENTGNRMASELDEVILTGDGSTQPQGITVATGTVDVTPTTPTAGPIVVDDTLSLMFGIGKQYRVPSFNPRFAMTDVRYKAFRALATGVTGDARLLFGMNVQSYSLLESPVGIENNGLSNSDGIFGAFTKYRLWRRAGFETGFERGGDTLVRSNTVLFWGRGRYAGKVVDANAFAITDSWPATA